MCNCCNPKIPDPVGYYSDDYLPEILRKPEGQREVTADELREYAVRLRREMNEMFRRIDELERENDAMRVLLRKSI